jgi:hypothetical protein
MIGAAVSQGLTQTSQFRLIDGSAPKVDDAGYSTHEKHCFDCGAERKHLIAEKSQDGQRGVLGHF